MVAGGGAGSSGYGGAAGGLVGLTGTKSSESTNGNPGTGGTQISGGISYNSADGVFGKGGDAIPTNSTDMAGAGGGGYYGGGAGWETNLNAGGGGGGDTHEIRGEHVVPVDLAEALRIYADLMSPARHDSAQKRKTEPELLHKTIYMEARGRRLDEGDPHTDLAVA